jgi:Flp pilus assembly protein TadG
MSRAMRRREDSEQRLPPAEQGSVFIEAALVTPLLMLMFLGVVQFGFAFGILSQLRSASAVAARAAILGTNQNHTQVCDAAKSALTNVLDVSQLVCQTSPEILPAPENTQVTVTLQYPFRVLLPEAGSVLSLSAHTTMQ